MSEYYINTPKNDRENQEKYINNTNNADYFLLVP